MIDCLALQVAQLGRQITSDLFLDCLLNASPVIWHALLYRKHPSSVRRTT